MMSHVQSKIDRKGNQQSRFEFHLDSHYIGVQIKTAVDNWVAKGIPVKRV